MPTLSEVIQKSRLVPHIKDILVSEIFAVSKEDVLVRPQQKVAWTKIKKFQKQESKILRGQAYQHVLGKAFFYGNVFFVDRNVLIPRPETELLVDKALDFTKKIKERKQIKILDIGTGSGCIIITLADNLDNKRFSFYASDISKKALSVARKNAKLHTQDINLIKSNLFSNIKGKFDLILANLPYGDPLDQDYVKTPDPNIAKDGGKNGFEIIKQCLLNLEDHLEKNGLAIFEIGYNQRGNVEEIKQTLSNFNLTIEQDLNSYDRFLLVSLKAPHRA